MKTYCASLALAAILLGAFYTRTDEIPIILAFALTLGFLLGFAFPRQWVISWLVLGLPCAIDEILIPQFHIPAPFEGGHPLNALVLLVPALLGTLLGRFSHPLKRLNPLQ